MSFLSRKDARAATDALAKLIGIESVIVADKILTGTATESTNNETLAAITKHNLHLVGLFNRRPAWTRSLNLDEIVWIDLDPRGLNYPSVLRSSELDKPLWFRSMAATGNLDALLSVFWQTPGLEVTIAVDDVETTVEYVPPRPHLPAGWYVHPPAEDEHASSRAIEIAKSVWRSDSMGSDRRVTNACFVDVPAQVTPDISVQLIMQHLIGFGRYSAVPAICRNKIAHALGINAKGDLLAVMELHSPVPRAQITPWSKVAPIDAVKIGAGAHSFDAEYIYFTFPRDPRMLRVSHKILDEYWRPVIAKALASPAPLSTF